MDIIDSIFTALEGTSKAARALGVPVQTVHSWKANRSIPVWRRRSVLQLVIETGKALPPEAFTYLGAAVASTVQSEAAQAA